jgi:hypothetical protein
MYSRAAIISVNNEGMPEITAEAYERQTTQFSDSKTK